MVFAAWYALPPTERKHRLILYLSDVERTVEQNDESAPWRDDAEWSRD